MRKLLLALMCASAAAASSAQTQTSDPVQGPTFRTGIDVIAIDVAVVDDRGRPIEDLHAADFTVKIDGEVRRVVSAELVKVDVAAAKKQVADKTETFFTTNMTPPQGRQIVLAIDQMNLRPGSMRAIMSAAQKFIDKLSPLDQVAFITYPEPGPRVGFTTDHLRLKLAMNALIGHGPRMESGEYNIGVSEAFDISEKRDQITLAAVTNRECRKATTGAVEQCQREIINNSSQIVLRVRQDSGQSIAGLKLLCDQLGLLDGPKSLILLSEGLVLQSVSDVDDVVRSAARSRVSLNVLLLDGPRADVTISQESPTVIQDRQMQVSGLQNLATMSRGSLFHVVGTGEPIFDRLASEISAYYLIGVEQRPNDREGERRRVDVQVGRRNAVIRSRQAFVFSEASRAKKSMEDNVRDALTSPFAVSGVPLRVTTFAQQDPGGGKVRLTIAAEVGPPGAQAANYGVGYVLVDRDGKVAASFGVKTTLAPGQGSGAALDFSGGVVVEPGIYDLRFAVADDEGRRGSIVREVNAWKMNGEELAVGDLIVGNAPGRSIRAGVEPHVSSDIAAVFEMYSTSTATLDAAQVTFEVADDADAPALATTKAVMAAGPQPTWRVAQAIVPAGALPPGRYVARARIAKDGQTMSVLSRPFILERAGNSPVRRPTFTATVAKFDRDAVLSREFIGSMLDTVEKRSATLKPALVEARAGRYGPAALEALTAGDQETAAFLRGLDLFTKGQMVEAATQLQLAAGPRREFFPAAFYLGATYAAAGKDRDAAGVWQIALGTEPRPLAVYAMAADARLRDGQPGSAIDILKPAYARTPDDQIGRRLGLAYVMTGRHGDALPMLDAYLQKQPADQEALFAAIIAQYEAAQAGQTLSNVDRAKVRRYAAAYKGPEQALVNKYVDVMQAAN